MHGGDRSFDISGKSLRYGINVPYEAHVEYLKIAELEPEIDQQGAYLHAAGDGSRLGHDDNPLKDPLHPFNGFYKQQARDIFSEYQLGHVF